MGGAVCTLTSIHQLTCTGLESSFRAEAAALLVACHLALQNSTVILDNLAVVKRANSALPALLSYRFIDEIKLLMASKNLTVLWTKGHSSNQQNNLADFAAKTSHSLTKPQAQKIIEVGVFGYKGEEVKHLKPITKQLIPTHHHTGIHATSWTIRRKQFWDNRVCNWSFGIKCFPQFGDPRDSWSLDCKKHQQCAACGRTHDITVYGMIATCQHEEWKTTRNTLLKQWGKFSDKVRIWLKQRLKSGVPGWDDVLRFWRLLLPTHLVGFLKADYIKKAYVQFVKTACNMMVNKLGSFPAPLPLSSVKIGKQRKNPHTWQDFTSMNEH